MEFPQKPKPILRGAQVEGVAFCSPPSEPAPLEEGSTQEQAQKASGRTYNPKEIRKQAEKEGYYRGLQEGQQQGYEAGKSEGFELGIKQGNETASVHLRSTITLLNSVSDALANKQEDIFEQAKPEMIKFCLAVCERIIMQELTNPQAFVRLINTLLHQVKSQLKGTHIEVLVSTEDLAMLQQSLPHIAYDMEDFKGLDFIADKTIERGNCRINMPLGLLNFDIKRLLSELEKQVLEADTTL